ncbi:MAG: DUF5722 domain-containing protein [Candidatus Cryptobacteroides sp.]
MRRIQTIALTVLLLPLFSCQKLQQPAYTQSVNAVVPDLAESLTDYLNLSWSSSVTNVTVTADKVSVSGVCVGSCVYALVDVAPYEEMTTMTEFPQTTMLDGPGEFTKTFPRFYARDGKRYDRALSRWAIIRIRRATGLSELVSSARYADNVEQKYSAAAASAASKKGLGAGSGELYWQDVDELGVGSVTVNLSLTDYFSTTSVSGWERIMYGQQYFWMNTSKFEELDSFLLEASQRSAVVFGIVLIPLDSVLADPENDGGRYAMPNLTDAGAVNAYAAVMDYMANRYSTGTYGRIHHWIIHNEVDEGYKWTNMGVQPEEKYIDRYVKSMRLCYNIVRQYDSNASVLASFAHSWYDATEKYTAFNMLEHIARYSAREGDFNWGVAYHSYPYDLSIPYFWSYDPAHGVSLSRKSPYVTPYNLEVVNDWILQSAHRHPDGRKRLLVLSEQGINARYDVADEYKANEYVMQAAGAAWMWKKANALAGIDFVHWHAWRDGADDGLNLGLRHSPSWSEPSAKKEVYDVWKAAATYGEGGVLDAYLPTLGRTSWDYLTADVTD